MEKNWMSLRFLSRSENEQFARSAVAAFAAQISSLTLNDVADLKTAVSEAVTNCIVHGYADTVGIVELEVERNQQTLHIIVRDQGIGIEDIEKARRPFYTSKPEQERAGMGFAFMESLMDDLVINSALGQGTEVRLTKKFKPADISEDIST